jgi:hypothetical protein
LCASYLKDDATEDESRKENMRHVGVLVDGATKARFWCRSA